MAHQRRNHFQHPPCHNNSQKQHLAQASRLCLSCPTYRTMTIGSQRLTEKQWNCLVNAWENEVKKKGKKTTRNKFIATWCLTHGTPIPHASSVTRRFKHKVEHDKQQPTREMRYSSGCGCFVDAELLRDIEEDYGESYKHEHYNDDLCINCNTKRFIAERDYSADKYIERHMNAKKGPVIDWPDAISITTKTFPLKGLPGALLTCPTFLNFMAQPILVRKLVLSDNKPTAIFESCISGGKHPHSFCYDQGQIASLNWSLFRHNSTKNDTLAQYSSAAKPAGCPSEFFLFFLVNAVIDRSLA